MTEFNFTQKWAEDRIRDRINGLDERVIEMSKEMSKIDKKIKELNRRKSSLADQMGHNMRYKNALVDELRKQYG